MKAIFITGTDTGVGKSVVAGLLARYARERGWGVITQKWIQTGSRNFSQDIRLHLKIMQRSKADINDYLDSVCPYTFKAPLSPHKASQLENKRINPERIKESFRLLSRAFDLVIVEGIGGALVPYNTRNLVIDIARDLNLAVLLVAQNKLGAINHTFLTIEALGARKLEILGIVFNNAPKQDRIILQDNPRIIQQLTRQKIFGVLPWRRDYSTLYKNFMPIGRKILRQLKNG